MKKKTLIKRIVSFVTALSLTISSTVMILPASADETSALPSVGAACTLGGNGTPCSGTYSWLEEDGNHVLKCNGTTAHTVEGSSHTAGNGASSGCSICTPADSGEQGNTSFTVTFASSDSNGNTITVKKGTGDDAASMNSGDTVTSSDTLTITAGASNGYTFNGWTVEGGNVAAASSAETTVTNITGNVTITAAFGTSQGENTNSEPHKVEINNQNNEYGTISIANDLNPESVTAGTTVSFTASPSSDGYSLRTPDNMVVKKSDSTIVEWSGNWDGWQNPVYYFTMPDVDVVISAEYLEKIRGL